MGVKKATVCRKCSHPREADSPHALCAWHRLERERIYRRLWRERHPQEAKAETKRQNALAKQRKMAGAMPSPRKPRFIPKPYVIPARVPDTPIIIGPEAFQKPEPVATKGHVITRVPFGVSGWGR